MYLNTTPPIGLVKVADPGGDDRDPDSKKTVSESDLQEKPDRDPTLETNPYPNGTCKKNQIGIRPSKEKPVSASDLQEKPDRDPIFKRKTRIRIGLARKNRIGIRSSKEKPVSASDAITSL